MLTYTGFKSKYPKYFEIIEILGDFYFQKDNTSKIHLSIDSEDLDILFEHIKGNQSGEKYLRDCCLELLGETYRVNNVFKNLILLFEQWESENNQDFPPQLPFIALFIIAASKMGEDADEIDWRAYYTQLYKYMSPLENITETKLQNNFRETFGVKTTDDERSELFVKLSNWISDHNEFGENTFYTNDPSNHRGWILNQCLLNTKDQNILPIFFQDRGFEHGNPYYSENQLFKAFKKYLSNELKARSFSKALRLNILNEELDESYKKRISETIKDIFNHWDGEILTRDGYKTTELLYIVEKNAAEGNNLQFKIYLNDRNKEYFKEFDEKIIAINSHKEEIILKEDIFNESIFYLEDNVELSFEDSVYKLKDSDLQVKLVSYEKEIRVFKYDEFITQEYVEIGKNESLTTTDQYVVILPNHLQKETVDWLLDNPNFNLEEKSINQFSNFSVIEDLRLINTFDFKITQPFLEVFMPTSTKSEKIELVGGLKLESKVYLSRELPNIYIPQSYCDNPDLILQINGKQIDHRGGMIKPDEYVTDSDTTKYEITVNQDDIKIVFTVFFDETDLTSHLAGKIGYDFNFSAGEVVWNDISPQILNYENLKSGHLCGGHLNIPNHYVEALKKINTYNFKKNCRKIVLLGHRSNSVESFDININSFKWIKEFSDYFSEYRITEPNNRQENELIRFTNYSNFNLAFEYFIKESTLTDLAWVICVYDDKIEVIQYSNKKPKTGFEDTNENWADWLQYIDNEKSNKDFQYINKTSTLQEEFDFDLLEEYITISKKLIQNSESSLSINNTNVENTSDINKETKNVIKNVKEFRELPGERLLRYISNVGFGTVSSLREAIIHIAESDILTNLDLISFFQENELRLTNRIIENLSYLLHIEADFSNNRWSVAKPSINLLPGLENRAIITGSRNDFLLNKLYQHIGKTDSYSVSLIDNSHFFNQIEYLTSSDSSLGSVRITSENLDRFRNYELFSPTTFMISEYYSVEDLEPLRKELGIEKINLNTGYSYIGITPTLDELIEISPQKSVKRYQNPEPFVKFSIKNNQDGKSWINEIYSESFGPSMEEDKFYRVKEFQSNKFYIKKNNKTHLVSREVAHYSQLKHSNQSLVFYKRQLPGNVLIIPSYIKLPSLYHKALGFCTGTNPKTLYVINRATGKSTPKLDLYYNIPEDLIRTLFESKLKAKIQIIDDYQEIVDLLG